MRWLLFLIAGGGFALALAALEISHGGAGPGRANPRDAEQVALGRALYARHCAACHGEHLEGQPNWRQRKADGRLPAPPHDDGGHTWHHPDAHLFRITKFGLAPPLAPEGYESDMPAFAETLSDDEIWAVLSYIKSTWSERSRAFQERIDRAFRKRAQEQ